MKKNKKIYASMRIKMQGKKDVVFSRVIRHEKGIIVFCRESCF